MFIADERLLKCQEFKRVNLVFPHVGRNIQQSWGTLELSEYIHFILTDTRNGERKGFPAKAIEDLMFLSEYHNDLFKKFRKPKDIWDIAV